MSQRRPLVAGNWKMHLGPVEGAALAAAVRDGLESRRTPAAADVVLAPCHLALPAVAAAVAGSAIGVAGQNLHAEPQGAFTGEVSGPLLRAAGATWVIIGHSERRQLFGETDAGVAAKAAAALGAGLLPILCLGETLAEREAGRMLEVVLGQLDGMLRGISEEQFALLTLAYEPVWAIGTGKTASPEQAQEVHAALRGHLAAGRGAGPAAGVRILYGGSVKPDNVATILAQPDVDGALVGGASLKADSFLALVPPF